MNAICNFIRKGMAVIVLLSAVAAMVFPQLGDIIKTSYVNWLLGIVMLGMGLMLKWDDFHALITRPRDVISGSIMQFGIMPLLGFGLAKAFGLPPELVVGVVLVGCCPGGTASNVITFLSGGDLALSVSVTALSTLLAPILTPLLVWALVGQTIDVDIMAMFMSIVQVVILPIAIGIAIRRFFSNFADKAASVLPAVSVIAIALIVIAVVSANQERLLTSGLVIMAVVVLHNLCGYAIGFGVARALGMDIKKQIALSIEVGMQNSGLACSLAKTHFESMAMATVPGAIFSVWHNISGALIARLFQRIAK